MRVFVYEHLCASGITSVSLRKEGWAMLSALVDDFQRWPGCEVWTLLDPLCPRRLGQRCEDATTGQAESWFRRLAAAADATLAVAPETAGVLADLCRTVLECEGRWLGCSLAAIQLCTDKLALGELWRQHGVPTPQGTDCRLRPGAPASFPAVLKPRDGAGSQATFLVRKEDDWPRCWREARAEMPAGDFLVQSFAAGQPASVAFLLGPAGKAVPLLPATQRLSDDGRFHYLGGRMPLAPPLAERAVRLAGRALACTAGLQGYVGVDVVLGNTESDDVAIEINPRLTTSYLGLRRLFQGNLGQEMWRVFHGEESDELRWHEETIEFGCGGFGSSS